MKLLTNLIDKLFERSWNRAQQRRRAANEISAPILATDSGTRTTEPTRTFTVKSALNGQYIEFIRHRWNPKGPDDYEHCVYIVRDDQTLVEAIATVLVLMEKPEV